MAEKVQDIGFERIQLWMQKTILQQGAVDEVLQSDEVQAHISYMDALQLVVPTQSLKAQERVDIYRRMYPLRMLEAMQADYPACSHYLGERFHPLVMEYVALYPSRSYTLNHLGGHFPQFIADYAPSGGILQKEELEFLHDLSSVELAISQVIDEEEDAVLNAQALLQIPSEAWDSIVLQPVSAFRLLQLRSNAVAYLQAVDDESETESIDIGAEVGSFYAMYAMVVRCDYTTSYYAMQPQEYQLLEYLVQAMPLAEAMTRILSDAEDAVEQKENHYAAEDLHSLVYQWFQQWIARGVFRAIEEYPVL